MLKSANEIISYFEKLYTNKAVYLWGANGEIITPSLCDKLFKTYGNTTYNKAYYDNKLREGQGRIGADCSGAMYPMSGFDTTAQNYYNKCIEKGLIVSIPRDKPCLVFKGSSLSSINHIGFYCGNGYVIEMKSSKDNCVKKILDYGGWKWYGVPTWINYTSTSTSVNATSSLKCIDVSAYQGNINWSKVKGDNIKYAILRGITKNGMLDTTFETNYVNAVKAGINIIGVYHFSYALNETTAINDAKNMITKLNGKKLSIYLDLEWSEQRKLGKEKVTSIAKAYVSTCKSLGYPCHIYSNLDWYKNVYDDKALSALGCEFWIARYPSNDTGIIKESLKPNIGESIWQYSSKGKVSGISGSVDMNIIYKLSNNSNDSNSNSNSSSSTSSEFLGKITASSLKIRSGGSTAHPQIGSYKNGDIVQVIGKSSTGWYQTNKGFISNSYVEQCIGIVYNCTALNMRLKPNSTLDNVVKTLKKGDEIALLSDNGNWYKCKTEDGVTGWVSKKYVKIK